jgi:hypothetical protein
MRAALVHEHDCCKGLRRVARGNRTPGLPQIPA